MKRKLDKQRFSGGTILSAIMDAAGLRRRPQRFRNDLWLMGMGGTLGRGDIRHCDTWEFQEDLPASATEKRELREVAQRRRFEAANLFGQSKAATLNDNGNR